MFYDFYRCGQISMILLSLSMLQCQLGDEIANNQAKQIEGMGPKIKFDPLKKPIAEVPFPNNISLAFNDLSPTLSQLNLSEQSRTSLLIKSRQDLNQVAGFAPFTPIFVPFSGRVDLNTITDKSILLVNIDQNSDRYAEVVPLDLGRGFYPLHHPLGQIYGSNQLEISDNHIYPLDNALDLDGDGTLEYISFYDIKDNILMLRPLKPLAQGSRYAVVILDLVKGWGENEEYGSVQSPFPYKAHTSQIEDISVALKIIAKDWQDLSFAWTLDIDDLTRDMHELREGLYGRGGLAQISDIPVVFSEIRENGVENDAKADTQSPQQDHPYILQGPFFDKLGSLIGGVNSSDGYSITFNQVDYFVFGSFPSNQLRDVIDADGKVHNWLAHWGGLKDKPRQEDIPFFLAVPNQTEKFKPPFPVMVYFHGTNSSRIEAILIANELARMGIATLSFDQVGHGPIIADIDYLVERNPRLENVINTLPVLLANILFPERLSEFVGLSFAEALPKFDQVGIFRELAREGRWIDVDGNQRHDPAEGFFYSDALKQCSSFWQDTLDGMQLVRILRNFSQSKVPAKIDQPNEVAKTDKDRLFANMLAGDFNADGILDIGGPDVQISVAGTSLGGFHSLLLASLEPEVSVATPIAAGGGLSDIYLRSGLRFIIEPLLLEFFGQVVVGCPYSNIDENGNENGKLYFSLSDQADRCQLSEEEMARIAFGNMPMPKPGTKISLTNLKSAEVVEGEINALGGFDIQVATDMGDMLKLSIDREEGPLVIKTKSIVSGFGHKPQTAEFQKALVAQQQIFQRCDPISFANQLLSPTLPNKKPVKTLLLNAVGDKTVPIATAISLANAIGLLGEEQEDWLSKFEAFRDYGILKGDFYDVDDIFKDNPSWLPVLTPPKIPTLDGVSGIRMFDVDGKHEWIAGYTKEGDSFDYGVYTQKLLALYHRCKGRVIYDGDPMCLLNPDCPELQEILASPQCSE